MFFLELLGLFDCFYLELLGLFDGFQGAKGEFVVIILPFRQEI